MNKLILSGVVIGAIVATGLGTVYTQVTAQTPAAGAQGGRVGGGQGGPGGGFGGGQGGPGGGFGGGQGGPGGGFGGGQGGPGGGFGGGMRMGGGAQPVVTATDKYVYVLRGETLFQYAAEGLKLVAKAQLPRDENQRGGGPPQN